MSCLHTCIVRSTEDHIPPEVWRCTSCFAKFEPVEIVPPKPKKCEDCSRWKCGELYRKECCGCSCHKNIETDKCCQGMWSKCDKFLEKPSDVMIEVCDMFISKGRERCVPPCKICRNYKTNSEHEFRKELLEFLKVLIYIGRKIGRSKEELILYNNLEDLRKRFL